MTVITLVTPNDIATALGLAALDAIKAAQWQSWIDQALYLIGREYPSSALDQAAVDHVVLTSVAEYARAWRLTAESRVDVAIDDGRISRAYTRDIGPFSIAASLLALLEPVPLSAGGAFMIPLSYSPGRAPAMERS